MDEIIEGCIKLFFAIFAFLAVPVVVAYYVLYGLFWVARAVGRFFEQYGELIIVSGVVCVGAAISSVVIVAIIQHWWALHQVKVQRKRALRKLEERYQEAARAMDELGHGDMGSAL